MPTARPEEVLFFQPDWCRVTFNSICDAVIITDTEGRITLLNPAAERLTGWTQKQAAGAFLETVCKIVNHETRQPVENPAVRALRDGAIVGPANHLLLIAKDGTERPIDNNAAPIRNAKGDAAGVILIFRDVTERRRQERQVQDALIYADNIIATLREPFLVLDKNLRVRTANAVFYRNFHVVQNETEGRFIYELGDGQWNIPVLRVMLDEVLSNHHSVHDFEIEHAFPVLGQRTMRLNASRFPPDSKNPDLILLAVEDITERKRMEAAVQTSEVRYRRLFETAKGRHPDPRCQYPENHRRQPVHERVAGLYAHEDFLGKELWEIGLFSDKQASQAAYRELQEKGYIRYEHLPLETKLGQQVEVEFVANVYQENGRTVTQCNIRDITERSRLEQTLKEQSSSGWRICIAARTSSWPC